MSQPGRGRGEEGKRGSGGEGYRGYRGYRTMKPKATRVSQCCIGTEAGNRRGGGTCIMALILLKLKLAARHSRCVAVG